MEISLRGYPPCPIYHCPRCGSKNIAYDNTWNCNGKLVCHNCGLACFLAAKAAGSKSWDRERGYEYEPLCLGNHVQED